MKKLSKIVLIFILFSLVLPLFASYGNNSVSAADTVDLTKIQHGHFKVYDWKEGKERTDITGDVFNATGGDYIYAVLYDPKDIPIFIEISDRNERGRNGSAGAFFFNPWMCNKPGCPGSCGGVDLGNMFVLNNEGRKIAEKEGGGLKGLKKILKELNIQSGLPEYVNNKEVKQLYEDDCDGMRKHLQDQDKGIYKLGIYGQSGDQVANPIDTFNNFEIASPLIINLEGNESEYSISGPNENGELETIKKGKDEVFWFGCQDSKNQNNPRDIVFYIFAGKGGGLDAVMKWILSKVKTVIDAIIRAIMGIVDTYAIIDTKDFFSGEFLKIWLGLRDICNVLFVLVLLGIAFMNFFGEGIDAYTIKKLLPRFLIAIIIINFSLLMCRVIVDFSNVLSQTFAYFGDYKTAVTEQTTAVSGGISAVDIGTAIVALILAIIGAIAGLLLAFLLIFRVIMIWLLVMLSPFVFLLWVLPPTQQLFSKWWENFIKYVFMGPVIVLILALAKRVSGSINPGSNEEAATWIKLLFSSGMIIAAAAVPLALGGMAMQKVSGAIRGVGKKVGGATWGATGAKAAARGKEAYMARVGEKRGLIGKIPRSPRARAKASAELSKVRAPIYDQMDDETTLAKKAKRGDVQAALMLARHERTDLLDSNMVAKHPSLQQMVKTQDPIGAGLKDDALKSFLDKADASQFTGTGVKNLLESNQELSDHHISAIATRGNQSAIDALHEHYATHKMPSADSVAGRAVLHSALASKNATQGSKIINNMNAADFGTYLRHASPNQVVEWQNSGVIDNLSPESLKELKGWGETNKVSLEALQDKGEISKDFFSKITKSKITK